MKKIIVVFILFINILTVVFAKPVTDYILLKKNNSLYCMSVDFNIKKNLSPEYLLVDKYCVSRCGEYLAYSANDKYEDGTYIIVQSLKNRKNLKKIKILHNTIDEISISSDRNFIAYTFADQGKLKVINLRTNESYMIEEGLKINSLEWLPKKNKVAFIKYEKNSESSIVDRFKFKIIESDVLGTSIKQLGAGKVRSIKNNKIMFLNDGSGYIFRSSLESSSFIKLENTENINYTLHLEKQAYYAAPSYIDKNIIYFSAMTDKKQLPFSGHDFDIYKTDFREEKIVEVDITVASQENPENVDEESTEEKFYSISTAILEQKRIKIKTGTTSLLFKNGGSLIYLSKTDRFMLVLSNIFLIKEGNSYKNEASCFIKEITGVYDKKITESNLGEIAGWIIIKSKPYKLNQKLKK